MFRFIALSWDEINRKRVGLKRTSQNNFNPAKTVMTRLSQITYFYQKFIPRGFWKNLCFDSLHFNGTK